MKVTLVCVSGITTSILANKLNAYAEEQKKEDYFVATRLSMSLDNILASDVVLVAPQARPTASKLKEEAEKVNLPLIFLEEEDLVFGKVEKIYQEIELHRCEEKLIWEQPRLTWKNLLEIYCNACVRCVPLIGLGMILTLFFIVLHQPSGSIIWGLVHFYFAFAIGYEYGELMKQSKLFMGLLFMASSAFILQIDHIHSITKVLIGLRSGFIPVMQINVANYLLVLLTSLITMLSTNLMKSVFLKRNHRESQVISNLLEMPIINGVVFIVLLVGRIIFF